MAQVPFLRLDSNNPDVDSRDGERPHREANPMRAAILPVPFEATVSYGGGTANGPQAILEASAQVELYDEVAGDTPAAGLDIVTLEPVTSDSTDRSTAGMAAAIQAIENAAYAPMADGRFVVSLGGEHSLTTGPVRAAQRAFGDIGVVQFDAHADLREAYDGTPWSHASVMKRILDLGIPSVAVGVRSLSAPEARVIRDRAIPTLWGHALDDVDADSSNDSFDALLQTLPEQVYLTFDLDFFDPSLLPATGTPEPGGGRWWPTLRLLARLFETKRVIAMDVVELAPIAGQPTSDFVAARLVYKCLGYRWRSRRATGG